MCITEPIKQYLTAVPLENATLAATAEALSMRQNDMCRMLRDEGTTYSALRDAERKRRCDALIVQRKPYAGIVARATGYSVSSVERAWYRWYGIGLFEFKRGLNGDL
jgi:hypothetical protein